MRLSIVTSLYQSAGTIGPFHRRAVEAARCMTPDYEIIIVNDGSPDDSLERCQQLMAEDGRVVVVDLSRNFGHHQAIMEGLRHARGEMVFVLDCDLEEEPEWLLPFAEQLERENVDVVFGVQKNRKGGWFERWSGRWYYRLFRALTGIGLPDNLVMARLMTRRYVAALLQHGERNVVIAALFHITGFEQRAHPVTKHSRGNSTYTLRLKVSMLVNSVTSFSSTPLILIFYLGMLISVSAGAYALFLVINWTFFARPLTGWTSVMASVWLLGGMIIFFIGAIGIYLSRIFLETKQRPPAIVRQIYGRR